MPPLLRIFTANIPVRIARRLVLIVAITTALLRFPLAGAAEEVPAVEPPWEDVLNSNYTAASDKLQKLHEAAPENPRFAVAYAASLLSRDPTTRANVRKARAILIKVVSDFPLTEVEYRPIALYLLGRIDHDHFESPQYETARAFYEQLRSEYPQHPIADQAAVHLVYLLRSELPESKTNEVVAVIETILPSVTDVRAQRDLHDLAIGLYEDPLLLNNKAEALRHLLAARGLESMSQYADSYSDMHIAGLARQLGMRKLAIKHYRAFAEASPRDNRVYTVKRLVRELEEEEAALSQQP